MLRLGDAPDGAGGVPEADDPVILFVVHWIDGEGFLVREEDDPITIVLQVIKKPLTALQTEFLMTLGQHRPVYAPHGPAAGFLDGLGDGGRVHGLFLRERGHLHLRIGLERPPDDFGADLDGSAGARLVLEVLAVLQALANPADGRLAHVHLLDNVAGGVAGADEGGDLNSFPFHGGENVRNLNNIGIKRKRKS